MGIQEIQGPLSPVIARQFELMLFVAGFSCVLAEVGMMAVFLGAQSFDTVLLGQALKWLIGLMLLWLAVSAIRRKPAQPVSWWKRLPAWLWVANGGVIILAVLALMALVMISQITGQTASPEHYVPVLASIVSALCFSYCVAWRYPATKGPQRFSGPDPRSIN